MALISTALALAQFVPGLTRLLGGDKAGDIAETVVNAAKAISGNDDSLQAVDAIKANPELQFKLQQQCNDFIIERYQAENDRLETVNKTMRVEAASSDPFVRRWRPFFGYIVAVTWFALMIALGIFIVKNPTDAPAIITAMASLSTMWGIALTVLGISVSKRSQDKQVAAGQTPNAGMLRTLTEKLFKPETK